MVSGQVDRRLAAILAADVAGYSRLMGADEMGTFSALKAHRLHAIDPTIASHKGRIVKTTGDGILVEFSSAIQAVACALDIQKAMSERNRDVPPNRRIDFRIGINIGDIIVDSDRTSLATASISQRGSKTWRSQAAFTCLAPSTSRWPAKLRRHSRKLARVTSRISILLFTFFGSARMTEGWKGPLCQRSFRIGHR